MQREEEDTPPAKRIKPNSKENELFQSLQDVQHELQQAYNLITSLTQDSSVHASIMQPEGNVIIFIY